jgi:hypothetical protein
VDERIEPPGPPTEGDIRATRCLIVDEVGSHRQQVGTHQPGEGGARPPASLVDRSAKRHKEVGDPDKDAPTYPDPDTPYPEDAGRVSFWLDKPDPMSVPVRRQRGCLPGKGSGC